jgi:hypothetical protein
MSDHLDTIAEWAQYASAFRKLKAYGVSADGSRHSLDCDAIVIELDDERGLIVSLSERLAGEGVAICSLPRGESPSVSPDPKEAEPGPRATSKFSMLVMRSGGANLLYVSPELHRRGAKPVEDRQ